MIDDDANLDAPPPTAFEPNPGQHAALAAIERWLDGPPSTMGLTGPAGTGKTTVLRELKERLIRRGRADVLWTAMTGKAATRMRAAAGVAATTLHAILYEPPESSKGRDLKFEALREPEGRILVVDEASMVTPTIAGDLETWTKKFGVHVLYVGDGFQLPPILSKEEEKKFGKGDYSIFTKVKSVALTQVMRNGDDILDAATRLRTKADLPPGKSKLGSYELLRVPSPSAHAIAEYLADPDDHGLVTWVNATRMAANLEIRRRLGIEEPQPQPGEPILVCRNGPGGQVLNGEVYRIEDITARGMLASVPTFGIRTTCGRYIFAAGHHWEGTAPYFPEYDDWKAYRRAINDARLPEPLPITYGHVLTAHKCVHPNTIVETPRGLQRIADLPSEGRIATPLGSKGYRNKVVNPADAMLRVTTRSGYTLDVTPEHGLFVWDGQNYARREARAVLPGAVIQFALEPVYDTDLEIQLPAAPKTDVRAHRHRIPLQCNAKVAEFLGLMVADGTVFDGGFRLIKRHRDVTNRFAQLCVDLFDAAPKTITLDSADGREVHSTQIVAWLREVGGLMPHAKAIPDVILRSSLRVQAAFLRGLFEDGTVNVRGDQLDHVEWTTCYPELARIVQIMLLRFGVIAARTQRDSLWHLYIYGQNAKRFAQQINFVAQFKRERLATSIAGNETRYTAPFSRVEAELIRPYLTKSAWNNLRDRLTLSRWMMLEVIAQHPVEDVETLLREKLRWHHEEIVSIEPIEDSISMCVEVPDGGRFLQNGSPQSNSQGSEYRRVTVFLPRRDHALSHFRSPAILPDGSRTTFGVRWLYTAMTRARERVSILMEG